MKTGILATLALLVLYAIAMTALAGWSATLEQFRSLWFLMVPLAIGFCIQVGLYTHLKTHAETLATGGASATVGMLACCAHHATDVLPVIGLTGASIFLVQYQKPILLLSLGINAIGITGMVKHLKKLHA